MIFLILSGVRVLISLAKTFYITVEPRLYGQGDMPKRPYYRDVRIKRVIFLKK